MTLQADDVCLISVPSFAGRVPAVAAVAEHSVLRQFAAGRPDEVDARELADFARKISAKLDSGVFGKLELAGVFAIPERWSVFSCISKGERVKLVRERNNSHDKNAIRVDMPFLADQKSDIFPGSLLLYELQQ